MTLRVGAQEQGTGGHGQRHLRRREPLFPEVGRREGASKGPVVWG